MPASLDLQKLVGQLFVVGFPTSSVPQDFQKFIRDYNLGGVTYFKHNVESPAQLAELANELQFDCRAKNSPFLFIAIDHEGGRVNRLVPPFTKFPSGEKLGKLGSPKVAFQLGLYMGAELKAVGINLNYFPVLDVATNPNSPALITRMFSNDPDVVSKIGSAVTRGLQKSGVIAVGKHFPGHGDAAVDSHFELPRLDKSLADLEKCELIPFRRVIRSRVEGVMTAHILNQSLDTEYPATLSKITIEEILRKQFRYNRLIFSDDMEMKAITERYGAEEAAVLAVIAGCDCLVYRGDFGPTVKQIEAIIKAVESKRISRAQIETSVQRILTCKKAYTEMSSPLDVTSVGKSVGLPAHQQLAECIEKGEMPPDLGDADERDI